MAEREEEAAIGDQMQQRTHPLQPWPPAAQQGRTVARPEEDKRQDQQQDVTRPDDLRHGEALRQVLREEFRQCDEEHGEAERSEEHTSELQSLMRISYAVFCLKKKNNTKKNNKY